MDFRKNLNQMRQNFELYKNINEKLPNVILMPKEDSLNQIYTDTKSLFISGEIHYGYIVQANGMLFRTFPPFNLPADIIVSGSEYYDDYPIGMSEIASGLYYYKDRENVPEELKIITDSITDEIDSRLYNVALPDSITDNHKVFFSTIMVFRRHVLRRKLIGSILPIITAPEQIQSSIILPKRFWTKEFKEYYLT